MATFKAMVYKHHRKADGTYNVKIRITHKSVKRNLATNIMVDDRDLTRSLRVKNQKYIDILEDMVRRCRKKCNEHALLLGDMTVDDVARLVADIVAGKREDAGGHFELDFVKYSSDHVAKLRKDGREGTAELREKSVKSLIKFVGRDTISVHEITSKFVRNWIEFIRESGATSAAGIYPANVRAILNAAKEEFNDEDMEIIRISLSPFKKVALPKPPQRKRRALDVEVVQKIFAYSGELSRSAAYARDVFMLSFLLVGMNEVDLFTCTDCSGGRITYRRAKTTGRRTDKAEISIKVEPEVSALLEKYRDVTGERVFSFYRQYDSVKSFSSAVNGIKQKLKGGKTHTGGLKELGALVGAPELIFYAARHSWATIARNRCGVSKDDVSLSLNHKENSSVTDTYLEKDWSLIDRANRKV
ncbi:MAG: site-specific integrase, partial [Prevotellaceae bacterium]|nr:site-specific integrase [Prevotellaceae bacterium]